MSHYSSQLAHRPCQWYCRIKLLPINSPSTWSNQMTTRICHSTGNTVGYSVSVRVHQAFPPLPVIFLWDHNVKIFLYNSVKPQCSQNLPLCLWALPNHAILPSCGTSFNTLKINTLSATESYYSVSLHPGTNVASCWVEHSVTDTLSSFLNIFWQRCSQNGGSCKQHLLRQHIPM